MGILKPRRRRATLTRPVASVFQLTGFLWTLLVWIAAGVLVYMGWIAGDTTAALVAIMALIFGHGLFLAAGSAWAVARQSSRAKRFLRAIETSDNAGIVLDAASHQRCGLRRVVRHLLRQHQKNPGKVDVAPLLDLMCAPIRNTTARVRDCGRRLIAIGLIGTCVGLMAALGAMGAAGAIAGEQGGPALMQALFGPGGPLTGMATAIATTLLGTYLGSVLLAALAEWVVLASPDELTAVPGGVVDDSLLAEHPAALLLVRLGPARQVQLLLRRWQHPAVLGRDAVDEQVHVGLGLVAVAHEQGLAVLGPEGPDGAMRGPEHLLPAQALVLVRVPGQGEVEHRIHALASRVPDARPGLEALLVHRRRRHDPPSRLRVVRREIARLGPGNPLARRCPVLVVEQVGGSPPEALALGVQFRDQRISPPQHEQPGPAPIAAPPRSPASTG